MNEGKEIKVPEGHEIVNSQKTEWGEVTITRPKEGHRVLTIFHAHHRFLDYWQTLYFDAVQAGCTSVAEVCYQIGLLLSVHYRKHLMNEIAEYKRHGRHIN